MAETGSAKPHVPSIDEAWLAQNIEKPIPTSLNIVDSHIHLWDFSDPAYFGDRYVKDAREAGISASVLVECTMGYRETGPEAERPIGEVEFACRQAEQHASADVALAAAIVGMVDVTHGAAIEGILEQMGSASAGRFRGIRIRAAHDPDPAVTYRPKGVPAGLLGQPNVRAAVSTLCNAGYSLDVYVFHAQLGEVEDLARSFPDLPIVLNHIGVPIGVGAYADKAAEVFSHWREGTTALARCENVFVKIGGFAISRIGIITTAGRTMPPGSVELVRTFHPWFDHCLEVFGAHRCMFGSNFPVDKNCMSMTTLVNAMKMLASALSDDEAAAFLGETARRFYRI